MKAGGTLTFADRFDGRLSRAVGKAVGKAVETTSSNVVEIKDKHGVIKDNFREAMADLTGVHDIPANSSFKIFKQCAAWVGKDIKGSWDRRSVPRVMHEVSQAAEILIVERFLESVGLLSTSQLHNKRETLTLLHRIISEWRWRLTRQHTILFSAHHIHSS